MDKHGVLLVLVSVNLYNCVALNCKPGWIDNGDVCYHFSHDEEEWAVAQMVCRILGGNLAEIWSQSENDFITGEVRKRNHNYWVGANDLQIEGEWRWVGSDERVSYTNWDGGQPDNYGGEENCVHLIGSGEWNDEDCSLLQYYVCESRDEGLYVIG